MNDLEKILDLCIDEIRAGGSIETCLERYPDHREELEGLLHLALALERMPRARPSDEAMQTTLVRAGLAAAAREPDPPAAAGRKRSAVLPFRVPRSLRWAASLAAAVLIVVLLGSASVDAVPGDVFYPLKMVREQVSFALTRAPARRVELRLTFANHRLTELMNMAAKRGRIDPKILRRLLREASLALEEARPLPEKRLDLFLEQLQAFNAYQRRMLERLVPQLPEAQRPTVRRAIRTCRERDRWMRRTSPQQLRSTPPARDSCWDDCDRN